MSGQICETFTFKRPVDPQIADLVNFVHFMGEICGHWFPKQPNDNELIRLAQAYWDRQHGED